MESQAWKPPGQVVSITRDEAMSSHVDDLLKRQMSLRGERGITREHRRKWCYRNWFVFMLAGGMAAFLAWALIEPYFDDMLYVQGELENIETSVSKPTVSGPGGQTMVVTADIPAALRVRGETIWLLNDTKLEDAAGVKSPLDLQKLKTGQRVGVYVLMREETLGLPFGMIILLDPPATPPAKAEMKLAVQSARSAAGGMLLFPLVAGLIGLAIGAADGIVCHLPRRAFLGGVVGLLVGFIGGFVSSFLANLLYAPLNRLAMQQSGTHAGSLSTFGFVVQMTGRTVAWGLAGMAMGLGQGIALRSKRLLLYGFLGGIAGGLLGGLLFDPIDLILLGTDKPSAHWSRLIGLTVIGAAVGVMIGIVELLARDVWLRMTEGPLAGKEFLLFKDTMRIGSSPRSDIYLFNDEDVADHHATLRALGDECEIQGVQESHPVLLNGRPVGHARLRHGDEIALGRTVFVFQKQRG